MVTLGMVIQIEWTSEIPSCENGLMIPQHRGLTICWIHVYNVYMYICMYIYIRNSICIADDGYQKKKYLYVSQLVSNSMTICHAYIHLTWPAGTYVNAWNVSPQINSEKKHQSVHRKTQQLPSAIYIYMYVQVWPFLGFLIVKTA